MRGGAYLEEKSLAMGLIPWVEGHTFVFKRVPFDIRVKASRLRQVDDQVA